MKQLLVIFLVLMLPTELLAKTVKIPSGTPIYGELEDTVTSKKKETNLGDIVRARVWRNVVVDGETVIRAGEPVLLKVSVAKPSKIAGRKGQLELEAISTRTPDGNEVLLDGGYDKSGKGRKALSVTLFAVVAWPLIFIKGKQAVLPSGTVFDGVVQADTLVELEDDEESGPHKISLGRVVANLSVEPLYDEMDETGKNPNLPVEFTLCAAGELAQAKIVTVNEKAIPAIAVPLGPATAEGSCSTAIGSVDLKVLGKYFAKGINRFELEAAGERAEIVLDVEL